MKPLTNSSCHYIYPKLNWPSARAKPFIFRGNSVIFRKKEKKLKTGKH